MKIRLLDFHCLELLFSPLFYEFSAKDLNVVYLSAITTTLMFRDRNDDVTHCADITPFSDRDVRRTVTDCGIFSAPISCVFLL